MTEKDFKDFFLLNQNYSQSLYLVLKYNKYTSYRKGKLKSYFDKQLIRFFLNEQ